MQIRIQAFQFVCLVEQSLHGLRSMFWLMTPSPFKLSPVNEDSTVATSHRECFFRSGATQLLLQTRVSAASDVS